jgi:hypothetical protein
MFLEGGGEAGMKYRYFYNYIKFGDLSWTRNIPNMLDYIDWIKRRENNRKRNIDNQTLLATLGYNIFFLVKEIERLREEAILSMVLQRWRVSP